MQRRLQDAYETLRAFGRFRYGLTPRSRATLEAWQDARVERHLRWVLPRSPFTRERFAQLDGDVAAYRQLPPMDKATLMDRFNELNTAGVDRDQALDLALQADRTRDFVPKLNGLTVGLSSGTSGHRGLFLASQSENNQWSGVALAKMLPGSPLGVHRIALLHRANSHLYQGLGSGRLQFRYFDLLSPADSLLQALQHYQPTVLIAPPCALRLLADALHDGRLRLHARVRRLISVAEVLEPVDRTVIEEAFQRPVHVAYVATEGFVASSCSRGGLHLNEDLLVVDREWVDETRRSFVPILTDFHRRVVPIIRYRLDDVLTLHDTPCPCGSPHATLRSIQGRSDDVFVVDGVTVLPDFLRRAVLQASPEIRRYVLVQTGPRSVRAELSLSRRGLEQREQIGTELEGALATVLQRLGAPAVQLAVTCEADADVPLPKAKVRRVRRDFEPAREARRAVL